MVKTKTNYVCITGASSGIGWETAKAFAALGHSLILVARRQKRLDELKSQLLRDFPHLDIIVKSLDLSVPENAFQLYQDLKVYPIMTWINNAGFGNYDRVDQQDLIKISRLIHLNVEALTILSSLYVRDYKDVEGAQLINLSSRGGYMLVPNAVTYCASKFYVSAFTEGLALELAASHCPLQAKVLAPAATKSEFGRVATDTDTYDYDQHFTCYHSSQEMAQFLIQLYKSDKVVGLVDVTDFSFQLSRPLFPY